MSDEPSFDDTRDLLATKLDQSIDEEHHILEVFLREAGEFYDAYAVVAVQRKDILVEDSYHAWDLRVHRMTVTRWGDILSDKVLDASDGL